jgi:hypothetical protein
MIDHCLNIDACLVGDVDRRQPTDCILPSTLPSGLLRAFILMLIAAHAAPQPARHCIAINNLG